MMFQEIEDLIRQKYKVYYDNVKNITNSNDTAVKKQDKLKKVWNNSGFSASGFQNGISLNGFILLDEFVEVINVCEAIEFSLFRNESYRIAIKSDKYSGFISVKRNKKAYNLKIGQRIHIKGKIKVGLIGVSANINMPISPRFEWKELKPFCFSFEVLKPLNPVR